MNNRVSASQRKKPLLQRIRLHRHFNTALISASACLTMTVLVIGAYHLGARNAAQDDPSAYWATTVTQASKGGASLQRLFQGPGGLVGMVVEGQASHSRQIAWGIPGKIPLVMIGPLFDPAGHNITDLAQKAEIQPSSVPASSQDPAVPPSEANPAPLALNTAPTTTSQGDPQPLTPGDTQSLTGPLTPDQVWIGVNAAKAVSFGAPHPRSDVFILADANCPYCNELFQRVLTQVTSLSHEGIAVHWIPVAVLSDSSSGRGAALLAGGMPALQQNEAGYNAIQEQGGIAPIANAGLQRAVFANTALLLHDGQMPLTPTLVWKDAHGVHVTAGEPPTEGGLMAILHAGGGAHGSR